MSLLYNTEFTGTICIQNRAACQVYRATSVNGIAFCAGCVTGEAAVCNISTLAILLVQGATFGFSSIALESGTLDYQRIGAGVILDGTTVGSMILREDTAINGNTGTALHHQRATLRSGVAVERAAGDGHCLRAVQLDGTAVRSSFVFR